MLNIRSKTPRLSHAATKGVLTYVPFWKQLLGARDSFMQKVLAGALLVFVL